MPLSVICPAEHVVNWCATIWSHGLAVKHMAHSSLIPRPERERERREKSWFPLFVCVHSQSMCSWGGECKSCPHEHMVEHVMFSIYYMYMYVTPISSRWPPWSSISKTTTTTNTLPWHTAKSKWKSLHIDFPNLVSSHKKTSCLYRWIQ